MRIIISAIATALAALPAFADETEGHVLAYDRVDGIIVLTDKTVWEVPAAVTLPEDLGRGDRVLFEYDTAGEDGMTKLKAITRLAPALTEGTDGGS